MAEYWIVDGAIVSRKNLTFWRIDRTAKRTLTLYRDDLKVTYSSRNVRLWDELTPQEKRLAYQCAYKSRLADALWKITKEPELKEQFSGWEKRLRQELDLGLSLIADGNPVPPPYNGWE